MQSRTLEDSAIAAPFIIAIIAARTGLYNKGADRIYNCLPCYDSRINLVIAHCRAENAPCDLTVSDPGIQHYLHTTDRGQTNVPTSIRFRRWHEDNYRRELRSIVVTPLHIETWLQSLLIGSYLSAIDCESSLELRSLSIRAITSSSYLLSNKHHILSIQVN